MVELAAGEPAQAVVEFPRGDVDVFGADERANAGALVALLDLVPPALALVLHHRRLFEEDARGRAEEIEQSEVGLRSGGRDRREEFPAGEDGGFTGTSREMSLLDRPFAAFECCTGGRAAPCEAGVDGGENLLCDRRLGERQQQRLVQRGGGTLRLGVETADGLDLVAEEFDAHGAVHLRRVGVEDAAAQRDLAGHLDHIDARVADREQVLDQHLGQDLFAAPEAQREGGVVVARKEPHAGRFDRRNDEARGSGGDLPQRSGAGFENLGMRGEIFKGQNIVRGQAQDGVGGERAGQLAGGEDGRVQLLGGLVVGHQNQARRVGGANEEWKIQRARGEGEAGDASSPAAGAQVAADTVEGHRVLKLPQALRGRMAESLLGLSLQRGLCVMDVVCLLMTRLLCSASEEVRCHI